MKLRFMALTRGHGIFCVLIGCRYPYWHGKNYVGPA